MRKDAKEILKAQNKEGIVHKSNALRKIAQDKRKAVSKDNEKSLIQAKAIGLLDSNESVNELVESLENVQPLYNIEQAEDRIDNKILCIMLMEGMMREYKGEFIPNFTLAGKLVGRAKSYMHDLWQDRDIIITQKDNIVNNGLKMVQVKLIINLMKMTKALDDVEDWGVFLNTAGQFKNFIELFDKLLLRSRLLGNLSTENVAHKHDHAGRVDLVKSDDM